MKRAYLISCSDHYDHRMCYWDRSLRSLGYEATYLTSDFSHTKKKSFQCAVPGSVQLHVRPYAKNLSLDRILSHRGFARDVLAYMEQQRPEIIVALIPPNFLCKYLAAYKKRHPKTVIIFDIFDLWPETFPSSRMKKLLAPPFKIWAGLRDGNLGRADYVTTECEMFRQMLHLDDEHSTTVPFALDPCVIPLSAPVLPKDCAEIVYLGAINNIIDIPRICALLSALSKRIPTRLHVIGDGEQRIAFCESAAESGAEVCYHGVIFDDQKKEEIFTHCHFGLNIMKDSVCIGLTMKSVDYLRFGVPFINSIGGDTAEFIRDTGVGLQLSTPDATADAVVSMIRQGMEPVHHAAERLFQTHFSGSVAEASCKTILKTLL